MTAALPLHSHALAATAAVEWEERKKDTGSGRTIPISCQTSSGPVQGSTFVPLFQLKVPPRIGGPPICPGPYAPAYTDVTPLLGRNILGGSHRSHLASLTVLFLLLGTGIKTSEPFRRYAGRVPPARHCPASCGQCVQAHSG